MLSMAIQSNTQNKVTGLARAWERMCTQYLGTSLTPGSWEHTERITLKEVRCP